MAMVALIMRPWIVLMRTFGDVRCFILADDVLILAQGQHMLGQFAKALNSTHDFLQQMGARVAPNKRYNFASGRKAATWLSQKHECRQEVENARAALLSVLGCTPAAPGRNTR